MTEQHKAYEPFPILEKFPLSIKSIAAYDGNLVVGTEDGRLLMYSISSDSLNRMEICLLKSSKNDPPKPIAQIAIVPEHQILIALSDQVVSIHDLAIYNFPLLATLSTTKGANAFDLDVKHHTSLTGEAVVTVRLVVSVSKKLLFFYWKSRQFHELREDIVLSHTARYLAWCGEAVIVAFKYDYWLYKLNGDHKELPSVRTGYPLLAKLSHDIIGVQKDSETFFFDAAEHCFQENTVVWDDVPLMLALDGPYVLAVVSKGVELRSMSPSERVQTMTLEKVKHLTCSVTSKSKSQIFVASQSFIWALKFLPISAQIRDLLAAKQFGLALRLTDFWNESAETKENMRNEIRKRHAVHLFCESRFAESMDLFFTLRSNLPYVIGLFPEILPDEYRTRIQYPYSIPALEGDQLNKGLELLVHFLLQMRHHLKRKEKEEASEKGLTPPSSKSKYQELQIIDTTLLKCYLKINDSLVIPLLRMPDNRVNVEEGDRVLRKAQKYAELVLFLKSRQQHRKALEILLKHSNRQTSPLSGHNHTVQYLQNLGPDCLELIFEFGGWVLKSFPEDGLKIFVGDHDSVEAESLPRPRVLSFIKKTQPAMVIPYLEHLVWEWEDKNALIHNELACQYKEKVLAMRKEDSSNAEINDKRIYFQENLLAFLRSSQCYSAAAILAYFPQDDLFEERAILLGRLGQHKQAISIYMEMVKDLDKALEYCHSHYSSSGPAKEIYLIFLKQILRNSSSKPSSGGESNVGPPLSPEHSRIVSVILTSYSHRLDTLQVLKTFPDATNARIFKEFILNSLIRVSVHKKDKQMHRGLTQAILQQTKFDLKISQKEKILISDQTVCSVCLKRFTNASAFAWRSGGEISHFFCKEQKGKRL